MIFGLNPSMLNGILTTGCWSYDAVKSRLNPSLLNGILTTGCWSYDVVISGLNPSLLNATASLPSFDEDFESISLPRDSLPLTPGNDVTTFGNLLRKL